MDTRTFHHPRVPSMFDLSWRDAAKVASKTRMFEGATAFKVSSDEFSTVSIIGKPGFKLSLDSAYTDYAIEIFSS